MPGIDLGDYYAGHLSLRRLRILIKYLPGDSKLARLINARRKADGIESKVRIEEADPSVWTQTEWMLVHINDELRLLNHTLRSVYRDPKKKAPPPPVFLPRPGGENPRRKAINSWFGAVGLPPLKKPVRTT